MLVRHTLRDRKLYLHSTEIDRSRNITQLYLETFLFHVSYFPFVTPTRRFKKKENISRTFELGASSIKEGIGLWLGSRAVREKVTRPGGGRGINFK